MNIPINNYLYGWLISTAGVIGFVYTVAPFFGWSVVPPLLAACGMVNTVLGWVGANWFGFNCTPPPPFLVTFLPQFILYWATLTGSVILLASAAQLIIYGHLYKSKKGEARA